MEAVNRVVIVGAGQAGGWAAKSLRDAGFRGTVTVVGEEVHPPYERPPLSKAVLAGTAVPTSTHLFKPALLESLALDWRPGLRASAIDRKAKRVELDTGEWLPYDRLVLCTGGRARELDVTRAADVHIHTLRSIDDALSLRSALLTSRRVLVIGGGWIGLEVAATAKKMGLSVRVVEALPRLCARVLPPAMSSLLLALHQRHGVDVSLARLVTRMERNAQGATMVHLDGGDVAEADCSVAGIGLVPNDELARAAGLECSGGIIVDHRCATSDPDIFAAGDVAVAPNAIARGMVRLESWQNAQDQGIAAARAALGLDVRYDPMPKFWSDQYDTNVQILGWPSADQATVIRGDVASNRFLVFGVEGTYVRSVIGFNAGRDMRPARKLIETHVEVDPGKLADASIDLAKL